MGFVQMRRWGSWGPRWHVVVVGAGLLLSASGVEANIAFQYDGITDPIVSATFSVDFAAMNAHRTVGGFDMNFAFLVDCNGGVGLPDYDLSDDLFGAASPPHAPLVNMGPLQTGWVSADIAPSFFPALAGGHVGMRALFTDTVDGMFAMDFVSLTIETAADTFVSCYGWPVGHENDGFGVEPPILDGGDLPGPLPGSLPPGSTGTGFDETISSKSILGIPEPAVFPLLAIGALSLMRRRR